jgi:citrate synthase
MDITTAISDVNGDAISVRGHDLVEDLLGEVSFSQMCLLQLTGRRGTPQQARMVDALLIALVEHGMVPGVISARLTYTSAPEALQGAVAAAVLGAGSVHLGVSERCGRMLYEAMPDPAAAGSGGVAAAASAVVGEALAARRRIPGLGHSLHAHGDPRATRLFEIAAETGTAGPYCELLTAVAEEASRRLERTMTINVTGAIGAIGLDLGLPWRMLKSFAILGRTLGALGHIEEEMREPAGLAIARAVRAGTRYVEPDGTD